MKLLFRFISILLAMTLCLSLCACGGSGNSGHREMPTEPGSWTINPQYVAGKVAEFMATEEYQKMVIDFKANFQDVTQTLIVQRPFVTGAIEFYLKDPNCHLLILTLQGDFCWNDGYGFDTVLIYDMDTGIFFDRNIHFSGAAPAQYAQIPEVHAQLLGRPFESFTTQLGSDVLYTQWELYHALTAEELDTVNKALGVEKPVEGIVYEPLPTEVPVIEPPMVEPEVEMPEEEPNTDIPVEEPEAQAPVEDTEMEAPENMPSDEPLHIPTFSGEDGISEQLLADAVRTFQASNWYQAIASDPGSIRVAASFEYTMEDFEGFDIHILAVRVEGVDTDMWGYAADTFLVDLSTGNLYHNGNLDTNNWGDFSTLEDAFAVIICTPVWESKMIWSDAEVRTDLPQSMIDAVNS